MKIDDLMSEWKECRSAIARFDGYLLQIRLLGASIFTIIFSVFAGVKILNFIKIKDGVQSVDKISDLVGTFTLLSPIVLILFITTLYILDRYYERLLLISVIRASRIECQNLEGFQIGLTTELEKYKNKSCIDNNCSNKSKNNYFNKLIPSINKASSMVNIAYGSMFFIIILAYFKISDEYKNIHWFIAACIFSFVTFYKSNKQLNELGELISNRNDVVNSEVIFTNFEILNSIDRVSSDIYNWIYNEKNVYILSIMSESRRFSEQLYLSLSKLNKKNININIIPVYIDDSIVNNSIVCVEADMSFINKNSKILIVDDVLKTGNTLREVKKNVIDMGFCDVKSLVMINKYNYNINIIDYLCFNCSFDIKYSKFDNDKYDYLLFGFGMQINGEYGEINHIGLVKKEKFVEKEIY